MKQMKAVIRQKLPQIILVLLIAQPLLDVLSYFLREMGRNSISTLLRFAMMAAVGLLGFVLSEKKRLYFAAYGVMALYWVLHAANCFRIGYLSFYEDTANYLRILTLPVFLLTFITCFRQSGEGIRRAAGIGFTVNMGLSVLFTALPWGLAAAGIGERVYTYDKLFVGVMGWFAIANAQSCIIILLTPLALYFTRKTDKLWLFALTAAGCLGLMFVTGTKLTYYSMFLIPAAFIGVLLLNPQRKKAIPYIAVLLVLVAGAFVFRHHAPMQVRESMSGYSQNIYSSRVEKSLTQAGVSEEAMEAIREGKAVELQEEVEKEEEEKEGKPQRRKDAAQILAEIRRSLIAIYTDPDVYGGILTDLNDRFGVYRVMEVYRYSANSAILSDLRLRKTSYAKLVWNECDLPTKILGFEYSQMLHGGNVYDLENDFPAVYYNCGWLGFALYLAIFVYTAVQVLRAFVLDPLHFMTLEMGCVGMTLVLALGSAQISGYVLRRPNVGIYLAVITAYLLYLSRLDIDKGWQWEPKEAWGKVKAFLARAKRIRN